MPKSISAPRVQDKKHKKLSHVELVHERTKKAIQFYSKVKKEDLRYAKQRYLQRIGVPSERSKSIQQLTEKSNGEVRSVRLFRQSTKRPVYEEHQSQELEEQLFAIGQPQHYEKDGFSESEDSSLSEVGKYPLREIHYTLLQVQKIIDDYLDFHYSNRNKRSMSKQDLLNFLKTTKYSLNCEKYINFLNAYNKKLYKWTQDGRIFCSKISSKVREERFEATRQRMGRKKIKELDIIFN